MCPVKLRTKPIFRIFYILKINRIMPFCNLFMGRPSYNLFHSINPSHFFVRILNYKAANSYITYVFVIMRMTLFG